MFVSQLKNNLPNKDTGKRELSYFAVLSLISFLDVSLSYLIKNKDCKLLAQILEGNRWKIRTLQRKAEFILHISIKNK